MSRTLYYTVQVTAENELGDRRTYDAVDFWNSMETETLESAQSAAQDLAAELANDGYPTVTASIVRAVLTSVNTVRDRMVGAGFAPYNTGGGCMAWKKDDGESAYWLVTNEDVTLDGDSGAIEWVVGHYIVNADRTDEIWNCVHSCTLADTLDMLDGVRNAPHGEISVTLPEFLERFVSTEGR